MSKRIVIGGAIAVGKTSLLNSLGFKMFPELNENDKLQNTLLHKMYKGDSVAKHLFQLDILTDRFKKWMNDYKETVIFDRMTFEDIYFAEKAFKDDVSLSFYKKIWNLQIEQMKKENKMPDFYILLDCNWENFKKRIFDRNRKSEIDNFEVNEQYFKNMINEYMPFVIEKLDKHNIDYFVIDTNNLNAKGVLKIAKKELESRGLWNEKI